VLQNVRGKNNPPETASIVSHTV